MTRIGRVTAKWPGEEANPNPIPRQHRGAKFNELCFRVVVENGTATLGTWRAIGLMGYRAVFERVS